VDLEPLGSTLGKMLPNLLSDITRTAFRKKKSIQIPLLVAILESRKFKFNFIFAKPFARVLLRPNTRSFIVIFAAV
jgi:hypothetical protein